MKKTTLLGCLAIFAATSCDFQNEVVEKAPQEVKLTQSELDQIIWNVIKKEGKFEWNKQSNSLIFSALSNSDQIASVGFKPANLSADLSKNIHTIDIHTGEWKQAKAQMLELIMASERELNPNLELADVLAYEEKTLPVLNVRIKNFNTLNKISASKLSRYAEPMAYEPSTSMSGTPTENTNRTASDSGCGETTQDFALANGADYTSIAPTAKASWNHSYHNIAGAWTKSTGQGVKVMVIDTGINPNQDNLGSQFNQGYSTGRTIEKLSTLTEWVWWGTGALMSPEDGCGHGTSMAGACAAPRGTDGNASGVAYNANLVTVRASADVMIDESREVKAVSDAYILAGNRTDVKITSMSLGRITSSSQISDAIKYAYNKGKLMFCAGGTSFSWAAGWYGVIFPAWMPEVSAVTGIQDNLSTQCDVCHDGSEIDFVMVMEKASNKRHPLTTAATGNQPGTVGGSSVATAQCAGISALVWSKFPTYTRDQVLNKMVTSASYYPSRHSSFGWGRIDANKATN